MKELFKCRLCRNLFTYEEMSDEHYPARSTGNDDIVAFNIVKMLDLAQSSVHQAMIRERLGRGEPFETVSGEIFDNELSTSLYPKGRTARTLCKRCNTFLGKYDEAYLKFFNCGGDPQKIKGFQLTTKLRIIKSIYGKFLSIPETQNEEFDFVDFIRDEEKTDYSGKWKIYFIKRDFSTDIMGFADIQTGSIEFSEGIVYEMSDDKFIFNLMSFPKHSCFEMTNLFDLLNKDYKLTIGAGESGGYHAQVLMKNSFKEILP